MVADEIAKLKLRFNLIYEIYRRRRDRTYSYMHKLVRIISMNVLSIATYEPRANSQEASHKKSMFIYSAYGGNLN